MAKALHATSPKCGPTHINQHGVDLLLGGHDHLYYVSEGVNEWKAYDITAPVLGAESGSDDILLAKSGTDFRDLSNIELELSASPSGSIRRQTVTNIKGKSPHPLLERDTRIHTLTRRTSFHQPYIQIPRRTEKNSRRPTIQRFTHLAHPCLRPAGRARCALSVHQTCGGIVPFFVVFALSAHIVSLQSAAGDWFADIVRHSYDDALCLNDCGGADGVFICAGTLRGDSLYSGKRSTLSMIARCSSFPHRCSHFGQHHGDSSVRGPHCSH